MSKAFSGVYADMVVLAVKEGEDQKTAYGDYKIAVKKDRSASITLPNGKVIELKSAISANGNGATLINGVKLSSICGMAFNALKKAGLAGKNGKKSSLPERPTPEAFPIQAEWLESDDGLAKAFAALRAEWPSRQQKFLDDVKEWESETLFASLVSEANDLAVRKDGKKRTADQVVRILMDDHDDLSETLLRQAVADAFKE